MINNKGFIILSDQYGKIVMTRQSLVRRIEDMDLLRQELAAWESDHNEHTACIQ